MFSIPVSNATFRRSFLDGNGTIEIEPDKDVWGLIARGGGPFTPDIDRLVDVRFSAGTTRPLAFGRADTLKMNVGAGAEVRHQLQVIWPGDATDAATTYNLKPAANELLMRLMLRGTGDVSAAGSAPVGPLSATFGVKAGGTVSYERLKTYSRTDPAAGILRDLFGGIRLPQQIDSVAEIPEPGEVIATRLGGYLNLSGEVSYGYSVSGTRSVEAGQLDLDLAYKLRLVAGLSAAYHLAGDFQIEARAGSQPNFARFTVRKSKESEFNFAADFGFDAAISLTGLPDSADEFLVKAFGADAERILGLFGKARKYSGLAELEKTAGKLAVGALHDLAQPLIGKALSNATLGEFVEKLNQAAEAYDSLDSRIVHLYEDYVERLPQLQQALAKISAAADREALKLIADAESWSVIRRLTGGKLLDTLLDDGEFKAFSNLIAKAVDLAHDAAKAQIREVIARLKGALPLQPLFEKLKAIRTPEDLLNLGESKLQGLVEQLLGRAFTGIRASNAGKALAELHAVLDRVDTFKNTYFKKLTELVNRSYSANLRLAYNAAGSRAALVDVEIDVSTAEGARLARAASGGDFSELLANYNSRIVRILKGVLTHNTASSTQVQINLLGYGMEGMTRVLMDTEEALEVHDGGILHVYTTAVSIEQRKRRGGELTASTFLLSTIANAFQPEGGAARRLLIGALPRMTVQFSLLQEDDRTSPEELTQILEFAESMGIVASAPALARELAREFPNGLGKVTAQYGVRYSERDVQSAFLFQDGPDRENLRRFARDTMRRLVAAKYVSLGITSHLAPLGFAYLDGANGELYRKTGNRAAFQALPIQTTLPGWFTRGTPRTELLSAHNKSVLAALYDIERSYLDRLVELDRVIDRLREGQEEIAPDALNRLAKRFVEMADDLDNFGGLKETNVFFAMFDRLVMEGSGGKARRNSTLLLEITPAGGARVTKLISPPTATAGGAGELLEAAGEAVPQPAVSRAIGA